jgi:hypothetical protein
MGGKVSGLNLHSRLTREVHLAGFRKYWRRAMPARISAAGFSCPGRVGFCAFWVVTARLLMSLPGPSSIAAGWSFAVRRRGIRLSDRGPFPTGCISPIPVGPFGSRDDGSDRATIAPETSLEFHLDYLLHRARGRMTTAVTSRALPSSITGCHSSRWLFDYHRR